jgi:hypothetical protein
MKIERGLPKVGVAVVLFGVLMAGSSLASAKCSADKIQRLSDKGLSTTEIAQRCHMAEDDVKEALDSDDGDAMVGEKVGGRTNGKERRLVR